MYFPKELYKILFAIVKYLCRVKKIHSWILVATIIALIAVVCYFGKQVNHKMQNTQLYQWSEFEGAIDELFINLALECDSTNFDDPAFCYAIFFVFDRNGFKVTRSGMPFYITNKQYHIDTSLPIVIPMQWNSDGDRAKCLLYFDSEKSLFFENANKDLKWYSKHYVMANSIRLYTCLRNITDINNIDGWSMIFNADKNQELIWGTGIAKRNNFYPHCNSECQNKLDERIRKVNSQIICLLHNYKLADFDAKILNNNHC